MQGWHLLHVRRRNSLHHLSVMLYYLLQNFALLVVENTGIEIFLEFLEEKRILLSFKGEGCMWENEYKSKLS